MRKNKTIFVVAFFCILKLTLHLIADFNSGFQGDELLHIETGNHLAFGYMEFPPVIGLLAFIQNLFHSQSVFIHHIFAHVASLLILIIIALTVVELGGKTKAVFLVLLCIIIAPCFGRSQQLFQPVVFSQLFWVLAFYQVVRFVKTLEHKYLLYLTITLVFGFLTKYDILFFIVGLASLLVFERTRNVIFSKATWKYLVLFIIIISPNVWWQFQHQFPVFQMFSRLYQTQLDALTIGGVLKDLIITLNPITALFWVGGFIFMFNSTDKETYRPLAISIILSICFLALSKSKAYYFYPAMITLLVFGSIWFEQRILTKRKWLFYPTAIVMLATGVLLIPFGLAILPLNSFIKFAHLKKKEGRYQINQQEFYIKPIWENTLTSLKQVYDSLPEVEKQHCLIWGKHYSQAGIVNLFCQQYHLPKAFSFHGSYYLWTPQGKIPETIIAYTNDGATIDFFQTYFDMVVPVKKIYNTYADIDKEVWQTIYICKKPRQTFTVLSAIFKTRVFE